MSNNQGNCESQGVFNNANDTGLVSDRAVSAPSARTTSSCGVKTRAPLSVLTADALTTRDMSELDRWQSSFLCFLPSGRFLQLSIVQSACQRGRAKERNCYGPKKRGAEGVWEEGTLNRRCGYDEIGSSETDGGCARIDGGGVGFWLLVFGCWSTANGWIPRRRRGAENGTDLG